jgi:AAHS family 4-hydroxybenzoate transporter-like MFS transporter
MTQQKTVNVRSFIDERPVSREQFLVLVLVVLIIAFDGIDVVIMGFAAPEIIRTWGITKAEMGTVLSSFFSVWRRVRPSPGRWVIGSGVSLR